MGSKLIDSIKLPEGLRELSVEDLTKVSDELREELIETELKNLRAAGAEKEEIFKKETELLAIRYISRLSNVRPAYYSIHILYRNLLFNIILLFHYDR